MTKHRTLKLTALIAAAGLALVLGTAHVAEAVNPINGLQLTPGNFPRTASTATRFVNITIRVPASAILFRSVRTDVTSHSVGARFLAEGLLACTGNTGNQGSQTGNTIFDDLTITCPWPNTPTGYQWGFGITN